jgi:peptidyl-prolyl cis-trans isomerase B (cyclophilin B)
MNNPKVKITVKNFGAMIAELYPDMAPKTVENFVGLVEKGFYNGLIFHRVIPGFMIQGGGFDTEYEHKEADSIYGEFAANGFVQNTLRHTRGVLSMARTNVPDSASSQFFLMHRDSPHLDAQYAGFGKVIEGLEVIDRIATVAVDRYDRPYEDVFIERIVPILPEPAELPEAPADSTENAPADSTMNTPADSTSEK